MINQVRTDVGGGLRRGFRGAVDVPRANVLS